MLSAKTSSLRSKERLAESSHDPAKEAVLPLSAKAFVPGTPGIKFNPDVALMAINASAYRTMAITHGQRLLDSGHARNGEDSA